MSAMKTIAKQNRQFWRRPRVDLQPLTFGGLGFMAMESRRNTVFHKWEKSYGEIHRCVSIQFVLYISWFENLGTDFNISTYYPSSRCFDNFYARQLGWRGNPYLLLRSFMFAAKASGTRKHAWFELRVLFAAIVLLLILQYWILMK